MREAIAKSLPFPKLPSKTALNNQVEVYRVLEHPIEERIAEPHRRREVAEVVEVPFPIHLDAKSAGLLVLLVHPAPCVGRVYAPTRRIQRRNVGRPVGRRTL